MPSGGLLYHGRSVIVPDHADIPTDFRPGNRFDWVPQRVLDQTPPWNQGEDPVETMEVVARGKTQGFYPIVVPVGRGERRTWAVHRGHHACMPGLSPFVKRSDLERTTLFTIELTGTPHQPWLVRAYPGEEHPPLPWMNSLRDSGWTYGAAVKFWSHHAYVWRSSLIRPGTESRRAPDWFRP